MKCRDFAKDVFLVGIAVLVGLCIVPSYAADGSWAGNAAGSWATASKWTGSNIADGVDATATFAAAIDQNRTVTLDGARTIGNMTFQDTDNGVSVWTISTGTGGPLTLDVTSGMPTLYSINGSILSVVLAGNDGVKKTGAGILKLAAANTYTGGTTVSAGTLTLDAATGSLVSGSPLSFDGPSAFNFLSASGGSSHSLGTLTFSAGEGTVMSTYGASGDTILTFASLVRPTGGAGNFVVTNGVNGTNNKIVITAAPSAATLFDRGLFFVGSSYAAYDSGGFVRAYDHATDSNGVITAGGATMGTVSPDSNVKMTGAITAQTTESINTLNNTGNYNVSLAAGQTLTVKGILKTGNNSAVITNGTALTTGGADELVIRTDGASDALTIYTPITSNSAGGLTKNGSGSLTFRNNHGWVGPTTVNGGTLTFLGLANTFTGNITANGSGSTLVFGDQNAISDACLGNSANTLSLLNGATMKFGATADKAHVVLHPLRSLTISGGARFSVPYGNANVNLSGDIVGSGGLNTGAIGAQMSGNNTFAGGLTYAYYVRFSSDANIGGPSSTLARSSVAGQAGFSILGAALTNLSGHTFRWINNLNLSFEIQDPANTFTWDTNFSPSMNSASDTAFVKAGSGVMVVRTNQTFSNSTGIGAGINGGVLKVDSPSGGALPNVRVSFGGGTFYLLGKAGATVTQSLQTVKMNLGGGGIVVDNNNGSSATVLNLGDFTSFAAPVAGSSLNIKTLNPGSGSAVVTSTQTNDPSGIIIPGRIVFNGSDWASIVSGSNIGAYAGYTVGLPASGASSSVNYSQTGDAAVSASETVNTLKVMTSAGGQSLVIADGQTLTLASGGLLFAGSDSYSILGGVLGATSTNDLVISHYGAGTLTVGAGITNWNGTNGLTVAGTGTVVLTGTNAYTGQTYVNGAVLSLGNTNQMKSAGTLNLSGGTLRMTDNVTMSRAVSLIGGGTFDVSNGKTGTFSGVVSGGRLTLDNSDDGNGVLVLSGANTFSSGIMINAGILLQSNNSALHAQGFNTLSFGSGTTATLKINGSRTNTVAGLNASSANAVIENGAAGTALLQVYNGWDNTFAGTLRDGAAGTLALTKAGCGKLTLTGNNTFTGTTTVYGGSLEVNGSLAGAVVLAVGSLSGTGTVGSVTVASGTTLTIGTTARLPL